MTIDRADASASLTEHFKVCDCHDSWDQCPCAEGGHPADGTCDCCPRGTGICGPKPPRHRNDRAEDSCSLVCRAGMDVGAGNCSTYVGRHVERGL